MNLRTVLSCAAAAIGIFAAGGANAQSFPTHLVRIVVPYDAGGSTDVNARFLAQQLTEQTKQTWTVENRPGASGYVGADYVSQQKNDGYTLLYAGSALTITPALTKVPIDIRTDLSAITAVTMTPYVIVVNPKLPVSNLKELMAYAKSNKDFKWAVSALGSADNLATEVLNKLGGADPSPLSVPYVGSAKSSMAVMQNEVQGMLAPIVSVQSLIESKELKAIALAAPAPMEVLRGVPTVGETYPGYTAGAWAGLFASKGTPADVTKAIYDLVVAANKAPKYTDQLKTTGSLLITSTGPDDFATYVKTQIDVNAKVIKDNNIKLQ